MNNYVVRTNGITKLYGNHKVLDKVSMNIKKGDIYGFVGKNGAGKTTMIRILAGLSVQNSGDIELFENNKITVNKERQRIGAFVEAPNLYGNMTAMENLELVRIQRGIPGKACIDDVLDLVNLRDTSRKKVKDFSFGMKQRLAISSALLSNPEFLILDEPINGLDPIGIREIRELLIKINKEFGTTILISSHILSELTQLVTTYGFIDKGNLVEEIAASELYKKCRQYLHVKVADVSRIVPILENTLTISEYEVITEEVIRIYDNLEAEELSLCLAKNGIGLKEVMKINESLEEYFVNLIERYN